MHNCTAQACCVGFLFTQFPAVCAVVSSPLFFLLPCSTTTTTAHYPPHTHRCSVVLPAAALYSSSTPWSGPAQVHTPAAPAAPLLMSRSMLLRLNLLAAIASAGSCIQECVYLLKGAGTASSLHHRTCIVVCDILPCCTPQLPHSERLFC